MIKLKECVVAMELVETHFMLCLLELRLLVDVVEKEKR